MTSHSRSTLLQSLIASLQTPTSKNKLSSFKGLAQFLSESSYECLNDSDVALESLTLCVVQWMSEEVKKIEYFYSKQVSTASMKYSSLTLLNLFESLVKCLTHHYYVYEPQAALPLITHILAVLQQKISTNTENTFIICYETYLMSLAVLIELESFVQILPTYLIPMIARVLLQTNNWTKTVTSLGVEKKIQLCLLLLRKNGIQQRQNLFLVVFTRIVSCIVIKNEDHRTSASLPNLNSLCHSLYDTILRHPFNFLDMLYLCPKLWIALHILIQSWNTLNASARVNLIRMMHRLLKYFQLPTFTNKTFHFSTQQSSFVESALQLLLLPIKEILLRHLSCLLSNPQYEESLHCHSFQSLNAMSSVLKILRLRADVVYNESNFFFVSTNTDFIDIVSLLSDIIIEMDLLKDTEKLLLNESFTITKRFFQLLEQLQNNSEYNPLMVSVISASVIKKLIQRSIYLSNETFTDPFVNNLLHDWMNSIMQNVSCYKQQLRHNDFQSTLNVTKLSQDLRKTGQQYHHSLFGLFWIATALTEFLCWCVVTNMSDSSMSHLTAIYHTTQPYMSKIYEFSSHLFENLASEFLLSTAKDQSNVNTSTPCSLEISSHKNTLQCFCNLFYIVTFLTPERTLIDFVKHQLEPEIEILPYFRKFTTDSRLIDPCCDVTAQNQHIWLLLILRLFSKEPILMDQLKKKLSCSLLKNALNHSTQEFYSLLLFFMQLYHIKTTLFFHHPTNEQNLPYSCMHHCASLPCLLQGKCHTIHSNEYVPTNCHRFIFQHTPILHPYLREWMMKTIQCIAPNFHSDLLDNSMNHMLYEKDQWIESSIRLLRLCMFLLKMYPLMSTNTFFFLDHNTQKMVSVSQLLSFLHEIVVSLYIPECQMIFKELKIPNTFFKAFLQSEVHKHQDIHYTGQDIDASGAFDSNYETDTSQPIEKHPEHLFVFSPFLFREFVHFFFLYVTNSNRAFTTSCYLEFIFANASLTITTYKLLIAVLDCLLNNADTTDVNQKDTHLDFLHFERSKEMPNSSSNQNEKQILVENSIASVTNSCGSPSLMNSHFGLLLCQCGDFSYIYTTFIYLWFRHPHLHKEHLCFFLTSIDKVLSSLILAHHKVERCDTVLNRLHQMLQVSYSLYSSYSHYLVQNATKIMILRQFLCSFIQTVLDKANLLFQKINGDAFHRFQLLWLDCVNSFCSIVSPLHWKEQQEYCYQLFSCEAQHINFVQLVRFACDGKRSHILLGVWKLSSLFSYFKSQSTRLNEIIKSLIEPQIMQTITLYRECLMNLKSDVCSTFENFNLLLTLGHDGLLFIMNFLQEENETDLLEFLDFMLQPTSLRQSLVQTSNVLNQLLPPFFINEAYQVDKTTIWNSMWYHFKVLPILQCAACLFFGQSKQSFKVFFIFLDLFQNETFKHVLKDKIFSDNPNAKHILLADFRKAVFFYSHQMITVFENKNKAPFSKLPCHSATYFNAPYLCRMVWKYATRHRETLTLCNMEETFNSIQFKYYYRTQGFGTSGKELFKHVSHVAYYYFDTLLSSMISTLSFKSFAETKQYFVSYNSNYQDDKTLLVTIFLGFLLKYQDDKSILVTTLRDVKKEWNQSIPSLYFLLLSGIMKLYGFDSRRNLSDLLSLVLSVSTEIAQDANSDYFHPFVLIYSIYEASNHIPQSLNVYMHWILNQFVFLPFSCHYSFSFQYVFAYILRYVSLPENSLFVDALLQHVARCISELPNEVINCLLDPSKTYKTHDTMLLLPWSPYWVIGETLVALLSSISPESNTMYETSDDQRNVWITSSIWSPTTDLPSLTTNALFKVASLLLILQTFLERQLLMCEQNQKSKSVSDKNDLTMPQGLLRHFGFEPLFLFPPLQKLCLALLPNLLTSIVQIFHKVLLGNNYDPKQLQPLIQPHDIRHTLIAITLNHPQRTFSSLFQKRYVMHLFSWLLFFYDSNNEMDPLLTLILKTSLDVSQIAGQFCGCADREENNGIILKDIDARNKKNDVRNRACEIFCFDVQLPFNLIIENLCYNISRQNLKCIAKSYVRLVNEIDLTSWFHSIQKNISLLLLLQFLSLNPEKSLVTLLCECFVCIHFSCSLLCFDPLNCSSFHFFALKYSFPTGLCSNNCQEKEFPYPLWLNKMIYTPSTHNKEPFMVLYELQNIVFYTRGQHMKLKAKTKSLNNSHGEKMSPQYVCQYVLKEFETNYPTIMNGNAQNYKVHDPATCFVEFPLLVWCYALCDYEMFKAPNKTCFQLINELCYFFLQETTHDDDAMLGMTLIICTIFLTRELVSILHGYHYDFLQKKQFSNYLNNIVIKTISPNSEEQPDDLNSILLNCNTLKNGLLCFLNQFCYKTLADICLHSLGLPMEGHMFLHLSSIYQPKGCYSSLQDYWICEHPSLMESLSYLEICSRDAYHGHSWHSLSTYDFFKEAHVTQHHWREMILRQSLDRFPAQPLCRSSPFSWWHAAGLLKSFPFQQVVASLNTSQRHDLRMEWLWRLNQWEEPIQISPPTTFASFHTSLYHSLKSFHILFSKASSDSQENAFLQKSLLHFTRQSLQSNTCKFNTLQICPTSVEKLMHHVLKNSLLNIYQQIQIDYEHEILVTHLDEWNNSLQCLNEYPSLFWLFEPLVAYQQNLLQILYNFFSNKKKEKEFFFISWVTFQKYYSKLLHKHHFQDTCLTFGLDKFYTGAMSSTEIITPSTNLIDFSLFNMFSDWLLVKTIHKSYDLQRTLVLCEPLLSRLQKITVHDLTKQQAQLACIILSTLAVWKFNAQWDNFQKIERELFKPAIVLAEHYLDMSTSKCHQHYAIVLDTIIQNHEKNQFSEQKAFETQLYDSHEKALHTTDLQLEEMDSSCKPLKTSLVTEKFRLQALLTKEKHLLKTRKEYIQNLAIKAIQHYSIWLRYHPKISHQTLRSTCRILSLWFQYSHASLQVTNVLHNFLESEKNCFLLPHFRPFLYQLVSRINGDDASSTRLMSSFTQAFQKTLSLLIERLILLYPFHTFFSLVLLQNGDKIPLDYQKKHNFSMTTPQIAAVKHLLKTTLMKPSHQHLTVILDAIVHFTNLCIHLGHMLPGDIPECLEDVPCFKLVISSQKFLPVPTTLPHSNVPPCHYSISIDSHSLKKKRRLTKTPINFIHYIQQTLGFPTIYQFLPSIDIISSGLSQPKIISVIDTSGSLHKIIVKGRDDLRTDAVTEQLFHVLNSIFSSVRTTRERNLALRTYNVIPLSPVVGLVQYVTATISLGDFLTGSPEKDFCGMHTRFYPNALTSKEAKNLLQAARQNNHASLLSVYQKICNDIQPVMHQSFLNIFPSPFLWFRALQRYTKSVALGSMVGYLLGLGDRHTNNIMLDLHTGELIHIDFGILFDRGETLSIPEVVPFRLTRDIVNGLGPMALEGVFRATCELTLDVLRQMHTIVTSILEVFLFDPLFIWAIQPSPFTRQHNNTKANINSQAQAALYNVQKKNMGYLHQYTLTDDDLIELNPMCVSTLVDRLFRQATSQERLCRMFVGWAPWL